MGGVEYQVTRVDPTDPHTKGAVYQVHKVSEEIAATLGGKVYRARIINDPTEPTVAGKVYQIVLIGDPDDPAVKGKVYNAILTGDSEAVVIGPAVSPLALPDAIADSLTYVKAFGGTEQRNLPDGYTQLEYIETTETQWIDTGVYVNTLTNPTIETSFKMNKKNDIDWFGTQGISQPTILYNFDSDKNITYIRWGSTTSVGFQYESGKSSNYFLFNSNFSKLKIDNNNNQPKYYVNDELIATQTSTPSFRNNQPLLIGRARTPSNSSWKSFKISDNGVDLFYGVPCTRDSDNVAGMYDLVSNQFFTNAGTGEFIAGPTAVPTPDAPMDIVSNNGVLKVNTNLYSTEYHDKALSRADGVTASTLDGVNVSAMVNCTNVKSFMVTSAGPSDTYRLFKYGSDGTFIDAQTTGSMGQVLVLPSDCGYFRIQYNYASLGTENILIYDSAHNLGIYTDGTVETINVHGKNLFDSATMFSATSMAIDGGVIYWGYATGGKAIKVPCKPNTTYTLSYTGGNRCFIGGFTNDVPLEPDSRIVCDFAIYNGSRSAVSPKTFTTPANCYYVCCGLANSSGGEVVDIQLEEGSTATEYEPYYNGGTATTEILLSANIYTDEQEIISGQVTRNLDVRVFDGTEIWTQMTNNRGFFYGISAGDACRVGVPLQQQKMYCTHFNFTVWPNNTTPMAVNSIGYNIESPTQLTNGNITTRPDTSVYNTVEKWKAFLAEQYANGTPVIVVRIAEPTTEVVAGQTLQVQAGDNTLEITQASLAGLELEAQYQASVALTIQEVQGVNLDPNIEVTIN